MQLLFFGALAFVGLQKFHIYPAELRSTNLDVEWIYRRLAPAAVRFVGGTVVSVDRAVRGTFIGAVRGIVGWLTHTHGQMGPLARSWPSGSMVLWVAILLAASLIVYL